MPGGPDSPGDFIFEEEDVSYPTEEEATGYPADDQGTYYPISEDQARRDAGEGTADTLQPTAIPLKVRFGARRQSK